MVNVVGVPAVVLANASEYMDFTFMGMFLTYKLTASLNILFYPLSYEKLGLLAGFCGVAC